MKIPITAFLLLAAIVCGAQTPRQQPMTSLAKNKYSLQYPANWQIDTTSEMGPELFLFAPLADSTDRFRENINVMVQDFVDQQYDLEDYRKVTESQITRFAANGKIIESIVTTGTKGAYYRAIYTFQQGGFQIQVQSWCYIRGKQAFLITFTAEQQQYEHYKPLGEAMLQSFTVK